MYDDAVRRGAGIYNKRVLGFYDLLVVRLSNSLAWRCPSERMLRQYDRLISSNHLDVGPGTGWYLANTQLPEDSEITLMDLNDNSMQHTSARLATQFDAHARPAPRTVTHNVLEPIPSSVGTFDSIGVNYLFHCVPGAWEDKGVAFAHLADRLNDDGVLFGSTILGEGIEHNLAGRSLMTLYNRLGIFHNRDDDAGGLRAALERSFREVTVATTGTVAMFAAQGPVLQTPGASGQSTAAASVN